MHRDKIWADGDTLMQTELLTWCRIGAAMIPFIWGTTVLAQSATVLRSSGTAEILTLPSDKPYPDGAQVSYDGLYYRTLKPKIGLRLKDAVILRTGSGGKVTIAYQNGDLITISENSFYKILPVSQNAGKSVTELIQGAVRGHVQKGGPHSGSEVRTKTLVMGVRGTDYYVARPGKTGDTEVVVIRGKVQVSAPDKNARPVEVRTGQAIATVKPTEPSSAPSPIKVVQADKGKLAVIQTETMVAPEPAAVEQLPPETKEAIKQLEQKAAENIIRDIRQETPEVYNAVTASGESGTDGLSAVYAMNTAAVESLYVAAPEAPASGVGAERGVAPAMDPKVLFAKAPPPEAPSPVRPAGGSRLTGATVPMQVSFSWKSVNGAGAYEVQIAQNDQFQQIKYATKLPETVYIAVLPAGTWWWRIRSFDRQDRSGEWSAPERFVVGGSADVAGAQPDESMAQPEPAADVPADEGKTGEETVAAEAPDRFLITLGIGGGSYSYEYQKNGFRHERSSSGGGSELTAHALLYRRVFTSLSLSGRSLDDFYGPDEKQEYSVSRLSAAWLFDSGLPVRFGTGLAIASETVAHPRNGVNESERKNIETLFIDLSVMSASWPKSFFQLLAGYGAVAGSEDIDVREDSTVYGRLRYQRQFFRFPLSLGLGLEYFNQKMRFYTKANDGEGHYSLRRRPLFLEVGYSF